MALGPFYVADQLRRSADVKATALFMRHGETAWNREGRVMGHNPIALDAEGRAQVEASVPFAREIKPDLIVTSPLVRARESAEIIAKGAGGVSVVEDADLTEVRYGRWEGMVYDDLIEDAYYARYRERPLELPTPGGETLYQVQSRGVAAVMRSVRANPAKRIRFVSHGDIVRTVLCYFMRVELEHFRRIRIDNAAFSAVQIVDDFAEIKFVNLLPDPRRAFVAPFVSAKSESE